MKAVFTILIVFFTFSTGFSTEICWHCIANNCDYCWNDPPTVDSGNAALDNDTESGAREPCYNVCSQKISEVMGFFSYYVFDIFLVKDGGMFSGPSDISCNCTSSDVFSVVGVPLGNVDVRTNSKYIGGGQVWYRLTGSIQLIGLEVLEFWASEVGTVMFSRDCYAGCA